MSKSVCVSVCLFVCLSSSISPEPHARSLSILLRIFAYGRRSSSGGITQSQGEKTILEVFFLIIMGIMDLVTKDRICLNLLIYRKVCDKIQFLIIKGHNCDYF